ncbi:MAG: DUF3095 family protein [Rhizobiaceae bacterium]
MTKDIISSIALFVRNLPKPESFASAMSGGGRVDLPEDWYVALTDVVRSRNHIANGRYKAVNMAGVAMISAVMNALDSQDIPFIFGGDGSAVAIAPDAVDNVRDVMAKLIVFASEELDLELRASLIPVSEIRKDGFEIQVKPVQLSDSLNNYAFTGGGLSHAEALMKKGKFAVEPAPSGSFPDLTGLSCRWTPIKADTGKIVSIIVEPGKDVKPEEFSNAVGFLLAYEASDRTSPNPVPKEGPNAGWPSSGMDIETRTSKHGGSYIWARTKLVAETIFAWILFRFSISVGGFDPDHYRRYTSLNTDFRKVQDGLRMTLSLGEDQLADIKSRLETLRQEGKIRFGICVQDSAVLTCYVTSVTQDDHMHFLDGAGGGYAEAASNMR